MKYCKMGFILFVLAIILTGCAAGLQTNSPIADFSPDKTTESYEEAEFGFKLSPTDVNVLDLVTKIYSDEELSEIKQFEGTIKELNELYPIECVRLTENSYRVVYKGESKFVMLFFEEETGEAGIFLYSRPRIYGANLMKSDFEALSNEQTLNKVKALDPDGEYIFAYLGTRSVPQISSHCTKDGFFISVEYDEDYHVINITKELI